MKTKILKLLLTFISLTYLMSPNLLGQFHVDPESCTIEYGNIYRGDNMNFTVNVIDYEPGMYTYSVTIVDKDNYAPFIAINPATFTIQYVSEPQTITFSGIIPNNWPFGSHFFSLISSM